MLLAQQSARQKNFDIGPHRQTLASLCCEEKIGRPGIRQRTKSTVSQAVSLGQLYYGRHTASSPVPSIDKGYDTVYIRLAKAVIGWKPNNTCSHLTKDEILLRADLPPSYENWSSTARLKYLARFVAVAPDHLHALVEVASPLRNS